jgi:mycofactocin system creatininase family protein
VTAQDLARVSWPQVRGGLLVVPLGSCEQHGPHLPFDVDTTIARFVATELASSFDDAVLGPAMSYGASGEHESFPGTVSIGSVAMTALLVELGRSADRWATRVLFVNGHGGNADALLAATRQLREEGRDVAWWPCGAPAGDAHAGRTETSLMLAILREVVQVELAEPGRLEPLHELLPALRSGGMAAVSANGVLGDPTQATVVAGSRLLEDLVRRLRADVRDWRVREDGMLGAAA